jgi:transposase
MARKPRKQEKSPMKRYTIKDFRQDFPDDEACLEWLKNYRWPNGIHCPICSKVTKHHFIASRKSYSCQDCGHHVHPTADTVFHKSSTPLTTWFYTIYLMAQTRGGIAAKQVERETGVTYKTAWRMCKLIRSRLDDEQDPFGGNVEADESYFGGANPGGKRGRGSENKTPVFGLAFRQAKEAGKPGRIQAVVVPNVKRKTLFCF